MRSGIILQSDRNSSLENDGAQEIIERFDMQAFHSEEKVHFDVEGPLRLSELGCLSNRIWQYSGENS